ncbi:hypothetical protein Tco_1438144, partial [Tanacetum coccineum]
QFKNIIEAVSGSNPLAFRVIVDKYTINLASKNLRVVLQLPDATDNKSKGYKIDPTPEQMVKFFHGIGQAMHPKNESKLKAGEYTPLCESSKPHSFDEKHSHFNKTTSVLTTLPTKVYKDVVRVVSASMETSKPSEPTLEALRNVVSSATLA